MLLTLTMLSGCATSGFVLKNQNLPISEIKQAIVKSLPDGKRSVVSGGREFYSNYFLPKSQKFTGQQGRVRYYAYIAILGDRRPYEIQINVFRQVLRGQEFKDDGQDEGLARVVMRRLQNALSKRRGERDFIDDFRVF